ncbi:VWA domain-containing protein [Bacillus amyloliquefaciens]|uniref:VWA domain-containing protein n=1 Tax=Bacillus amyloliquefaciens TaxID=1390 RepID=UPI0022AEEBDF|nr:VWA domain-containing protein [Bacillus amyloliquefaciens]MCZ4246996.1 VWA domain-containing protein [Bacillus amyloliquefaciens]
MDKLQEIKARISKLKGYENAKPTDQYWMTKEHIDFLIDRTELSVKQQAIIEENKRQQEVTANQFRQAQKDIKLLQAENKRYRNALEFYADETTYTNEFEDCPPAVQLDRGQTARKALEGAAE